MTSDPSRIKVNRNAQGWFARFQRGIGRGAFAVMTFPMLYTIASVCQEMDVIDKMRGDSPTVGLLRTFMLPPREDPLETQKRRRINDAPWIPWLGLKHREIPE